MIRRQFLTGALAILAAPAVIRPGLLMPVRPLRDSRLVNITVTLTDPGAAWVQQQMHTILTELLLANPAIRYDDAGIARIAKIADDVWAKNPWTDDHWRYALTNAPLTQEPHMPRNAHQKPAQAGAPSPRQSGARYAVQQPPLVVMSSDRDVCTIAGDAA